MYTMKLSIAVITRVADAQYIFWERQNRGFRDKTENEQSGNLSALAETSLLWESLSSERFEILIGNCEMPQDRTFARSLEP